MAQGENAARRNRDLWKPGPLSGWCQNSQNKRLARRIRRHKIRLTMRRVETLPSDYR